jgi:16S rRNA (uracil1498-N3)-methyltransferase
VARRVHTTAPLRAGEIVLGEREAHHVRDVLRLGAGDAVEVFDDAGAVAPGTIVSCDAGGVVVRVDDVTGDDPGAAVALTIASAVPKGDRADWMVEKLSELGVARFIPLAAARSVVLPEGRNKRERWTRIATEAAKQSRRRGVMRIDELTRLIDALRGAPSAPAGIWHLSTTAPATPILDLVGRSQLRELTAFIGPEGGWTADEIELFEAADAVAVRMTSTILRIETAAIAVAAVVGSISPPQGRPVESAPPP